MTSALPPPPPPPPPPATVGVPSVGSPPPLQTASIAAAVAMQPIGPVEDAIVRTFGLTKRYGQLVAVDSVDLSVPRGSVYGLIGPNGAGKTTLMTMVASLLTPTAGSVSVDGADPSSAAGLVRARTGYMPDGLGVYEGLDVTGYLEFFAAAYKIPAAEWATLIAGLLELVDLEVKREAQVNSLSRGMKQRLSLARALIHDPELLILDEPASGLDPRARVELRELLWQLQSMGKTIVISSHILSELEEICTHVGIMEAGRLLAEGSPEAIGQGLGVIRRVRVVYADGGTEEFDVPDRASQVELLRRLVNEEGREVVEFRELAADLEDVFMNVTKGIVQ